MKLYNNSVLSTEKNSLNEENIIIFPTIFKERVTLKNIESSELKLFIFSQNGQLIKKIITKEKKKNILLNDISNGLYILKILNSTNGNIEYRKIIKK